MFAFVTGTDQELHDDAAERRGLSPWKVHHAQGKDFHNGLILTCVCLHNITRYIYELVSLHCLIRVSCQRL